MQQRRLRRLGLRVELTPHARPCPQPSARARVSPMPSSPEPPVLASSGWAVLDFPSAVRLDAESPEVDLRKAVMDLLGLPAGESRIRVTPVEPSFSGYQASTRAAMSLHTDNTHMEHPCHYMMLICKEQATTGGLTRLLDPYADIEALPDDVIVELRKPKWQWERAPTMGGGLTPPRVVIDDLGQIRWWRLMLRPRDKFDQQIADLFDDALRSSPHIESLSIGPDQVLVINNRRLLHGRSEFTGSRKMIRIQIWM